MAQRVGSFGYEFPITVVGRGDLSQKDLRVVFTRPDGSSFDRTTVDGDVTITTPGEKETVLGVNVKDGDWSMVGEYKYQVWDESDDAVIKGGTQYLYVGESLELPTVP